MGFWRYQMNLRKLLFLFALLIFFTSLGQAQSRDSGAFLGTVFNKEGSPLPSASVTVKNIDMGLTQTIVTNKDGRYRIERLPRGFYNITASLQGFNTLVKEKIELSIGAELKVDFYLEVGKIEEQVTVIGSAPLVETTRAQVSTVITEKEFLSYPQGNRNYLSLMAFAPGAIPSGYRSGYAINGQRDSANNFMIDGIDNNDNGESTSDVTSLPPEAIQEFRLISNNFSAEYGRNSGGAINAVMKSGSNEFHGSVWAFHRGSSSLYQTADWLTHDYPPMNRWQYGFTIGGPIIKDKTFFFASFEGIWQDDESRTPYLFFTPEAISKAKGSAKQFFDTYGATYPKPTYDFVDLDQDGSYDAGKYVWDGTGHTRAYTAGLKIDHIFSNKDRIAFRWLYNTYNRKYDLVNVPGNIKENPYSFNTGGLTWLHFFNSTMYNEARLGYHRDSISWPRVAPEVPIFGGNFYFSDGVRSIGDNRDPEQSTYNTYQLVDVFSLQKGNHSIKFGGEIRLWNSDSWFDANVAGYYLFNSSLYWMYDQGAYLLDVGINPPDPPAGNPYVTGDASGTWEKGDSRRKWQGLEGGLFAQDDWRVTNRLTVSLGLRWEYYGVPNEKSDRGINMPAFGTEQGYLNTQAGNYDITEGSNNREGIKYLIFDGRQLLGEGLWNSYYKAFAPKVSFAYDLTGDGKTSLRGGWGISYDRTFNNTYENDRFNYPDFTFVTILAYPITPTIPVTIPTQYISGYGVALRWMMPDLKPQKAHNWLFGIQRELSPNVSIEINYSGSRGSNLGSIQRPNRFTGDALDGIANGINPYCSISQVNSREQNMRSNYSALTVTVNKRFSDGWSWYTAYTYGNAKDQNSDYFGDNSTMEAVCNERLDDEYGYAQFDRRHRLVGGFVWDIPWGKKSGNWAIKNILAGWQVSGTFHYTSGQPFTIAGYSGSTDWNYDYDEYDRPLWTGNNYQDIIIWRNGTPGWDKSSFGIPAQPTGADDFNYYNQSFVPRNAFRWFPTYNLNLAFQKYFAVPMGGGRDLNLQLIAEVFNVFKWLFWDLPPTSWTSSLFGQSQRMSGQRTLQLSLRIMF